VGVRGDRKRCDRGKGGWKKQTSSVYRVGMSGVTGRGNAGNPFLGRIRGGWRTILGIPRVLNEECERTTDGCGRCIDGGHSRIGPRCQSGLEGLTLLAALWAVGWCIALFWTGRKKNENLDKRRLSAAPVCAYPLSLCPADGTVHIRLRLRRRRFLEPH
jgi:hypothetical protein